MSPWVYPDPSQAVVSDGVKERLDWYWGAGVGTTASSPPQQIVWLLGGIHAAGPKLTPKTFQQGLFSVPAFGGAAQGYPTGTMTGYGKNAGLPYDEYMQVGIDFGVVWWDPETSGPSQGTGTEGKGVGWYADGAKRFRSGDGPEAAVRLVRQGHVRLQVRHPPDAHADVCGRLHGLPEPGWRRAGRHTERRRIRRQVKRSGAKRRRSRHELQGVTIRRARP